MTSTIQQISFNNQGQIAKCIEIASMHMFENMIILGDLYPPCNRQTEVYGIFDENKKLIAPFTIFYGFKDPSVVIPYNLENQYFDEIISFLKPKLPEKFGLPTFDLTENQIRNFFDIIGVTSEYCMICDTKEEVDRMDLTSVIKYKEQDYEKICEFYKSICAYPFVPDQLESGFYHYIEQDKMIVSVGGTHFETPVLAQIGNIFTLKEYRRRGFGMKVVSAIVKQILQRKDFASLFVLKDNKAAISLYKKLGFNIYNDVRIFFLRND
ncbi:MAG: GNAT family N-acetyltransferase [Candidatus Heimdallarchaeaceae archaeon]